MVKIRSAWIPGLTSDSRLAENYVKKEQLITCTESFSWKFDVSVFSNFNFKLAFCGSGLRLVWGQAETAVGRGHLYPVTKHRTL